MLDIQTFTGGIFETNCFLISTPNGKILIDAPQGADDRFANESIKLLLLTHGHFDHVVDAAQIMQRHQCPAACHPDTLPLVTSSNAFIKHGFNLEIQPFTPQVLLQEAVHTKLLDLTFQILHVPGHCPGSLCFYHADSGILFGGDVLFRQGIGRWDLPGGNRELLLDGIRKKILPLPPATLIFPGHGPSTTIEDELANNPFLRN